ncbi:alkaline phytoceramidase [Martensiomyces pterosporus]|nr:alkaline phytoceramidase [Martensiomyces pterosporus]
MGMIILDTANNATSYFWGERTSTIDWCEENYVVSKYVAEFWNCITNSMFMILALLGMYSAIKHRQGKRVLMCYVGQLAVGIGSALFHATLKHTTQLLDELPMLYLCAIAFYSLVEIDKNVRYGWKLPAAIIAFQLIITLTYIFWIQSPAFHQVAFALTVIGATAFGYTRLSEISISSRTKRKFNRLLLLGSLGMLGGFFVWNIDNIFCHQLRSYRSYVNSPLDALLQLHGWWHILTAYGCSYLLLWVHLARIARLGHDHLFTIRHCLGLFPYIALKTPKKVD